MSDDIDLIRLLEEYYDAVPRLTARTEEIGPFTLFVATSGWPFYARPSIAATIEIGPDDVRRVIDRQRELGVPEAIEWVDQVTPGLAETIETMGIGVERCPLLALDGEPLGAAEHSRMIEPDEADLLQESRAAITVAFEHGGTARADADTAARDAVRTRADFTRLSDTFAERLTTGELRAAVAFAPSAIELGAVGGGSFVAVGPVAEIAGVGVLPAYRRLGLAGQVTYTLATDARSAGVATVFCSAQSVEVARTYERVGFRRIGTACIAQA